MYGNSWIPTPNATSESQDWNTGETPEFTNFVGDEEEGFFSFTENELVDADALATDQEELILGGSPEDTDREICNNVKQYLANEQLKAAEKSEAEGRDAFLEFVSVVNPSAKYKVEEWQAYSEGQQNFYYSPEHSFSIQHHEPPSSPDSVSSADSRGSQSYVPSEATDSTFKPNADDVSSDSSSDFIDDICSRDSTPPKRTKRKKRRPSATSTKTSQNPSKIGPGRRSKNVKVYTSCSEKPTFVKKIKFERVQRRTSVTPPPRVPSPNSRYFETADYGWEYSEDNDLSPVEQIVDMCMDMPEDPVFYPLRLLRFGLDG